MWKRGPALPRGERWGLGGLCTQESVASQTCGLPLAQPALQDSAQHLQSTRLLWLIVMNPVSSMPVPRHPPCPGPDISIGEKSDFSRVFLNTYAINGQLFDL